VTDQPMTADARRGAVFWICVLALFTAAFSFSLRTGASGAIKEMLFDPIDPANSGRMIGDALGASFLGFAISLLLVSPLMDVLGAKRVLVGAASVFVLGPILIILAPMAPPEYVVLLVNWGMILSGLGWGATEASINPIVAAMYPTDKTHKLNMLHAWWPAGIVVGGLTSIAAFEALQLDWRVTIALIVFPGLWLGVWASRGTFPRTESASLGVGFKGMILEPFKRPSFWIFPVIMFLTASVELAPGSWVDVTLSRVVGMPGIAVLVYVAAVMFVMRHFAGALSHRLSDIGLLCISTVPAALGLYLLSTADSPASAFVAATAWAVGVAFMWPTMLAAVSRRYPRGGSWTIGLVGFAAAIATRYVLPELGSIYDRAKIESAGGEEAFRALTEGPELARALAYAAQRSFEAVAVIPVVLLFVFAALWLVERRRRLGDPDAP